MSSADLRHLGQPDRHAFEAGRRDGLQQRVAEGRAARAGANGERQALHEARDVVLRLRRQPRHDPALRQMLAAPLRQQRGLAEAGRRLHQDHRVVAQLLVVGLQAGPRDLVARHARRRDLQQQVVWSAGRVTEKRGCHRVEGRDVGVILCICPDIVGASGGLRNSCPELSAQPSLSPPAAAAARTAGCRRGGSSPPRSACRCAACSGELLRGCRRRA